MLDEVLLWVHGSRWGHGGPVQEHGGGVLVGKHVHFALDSHGQSEELVLKRGSTEEAHTLRVRDLETREGWFGTDADSLVVELLEWYCIKVVGLFRIS